jgi:hypothetical protein
MYLLKTISEYLKKIFPHRYKCGDVVSIISNTTGHRYEIGTVLVLGRIRIPPDFHNVWYGPGMIKGLVSERDIKLESPAGTRKGRILYRD